MATKNSGDAQALTLQTKDNTLPAYLQNQQKTERIGNVDRSDLIIPRIKLLQALSPEVVEDVEGAKVGLFWHVTASQPLGNALRVVPIIMRKTYVLWAPRGDDRGILARASDGKHWDTPNMTFEFKPKGSPKTYKYNLGETVGPDIGLGKFGTLIPDDPQSVPAANLTYEMLVLLPDFLDLGPAIILNTRASVKPMRDFLTKIDASPVDHYYQEYIMKSVDQKGAEGPFKNFAYVKNGYADEGVGKQAKELHDYYKENNFRASDETEDEATEGDAPASRSSVKDDGREDGDRRF